jgi:hypothetical protein
VAAAAALINFLPKNARITFALACYYEKRNAQEDAMAKAEIKSMIVGERILKTTRDLESGVFTSECWHNRHKQLDRESGPARITRDPRTGYVQKEWFQNGVPYRADGAPDNVYEDCDGNIISAVHTPNDHIPNTTVDAA